MKYLYKLISSKILEYDELDQLDRQLLEIARLARERAVAPYSKHKVGAAVLSRRQQTIHPGCNIECANWNGTTHAEQAAIAGMISHEGPGRIWRMGLIGAPESVEVVLPPTRTGDEITDLTKVPVPCGHCLQIWWEHCWGDGTIEVVALCPNGQVAITAIDSAFPIRFGPDDLGVNYSRS